MPRIIVFAGLALAVAALWWALDRASDPEVSSAPPAPGRAPILEGAPSETPELAARPAGEDQAHPGAASSAGAEPPPGGLADGPGSLGYRRGLEAERRGDYEAALLAFGEALEIDPRDADSLLAAGRAARRLGRLDEAEALLQRALAVQEETLGPDALELAATLGELGGIAVAQKRYEEAEALYQRALGIQEKTLGPDAAELAGTLGELGRIAAAQKRYEEAEVFYHRALAIEERVQGNVPSALARLAYLYQIQSRDEEALPLLEAAVAYEERAHGLDHPDVAARLSALAMLHRNEGRFSEAEALLERALLIRESSQGPDHSETAGALTSLARLYDEQGRYAEAEPLLLRALAIHEKGYGGQHTTVALDLANLGVHHLSQGNYAEAEPFYERALMIESTNPQVLAGLVQLARTARAEGRSEDAMNLYEWALGLSERILGPESPNTAFVSVQYAEYLRAIGREEEAAELSSQP